MRDLEDIKLRYSFEDDGEEWKYRELREAAQDLHKLSLQILKTCRGILETLPDDESDPLYDCGRLIREEAYKLTPKISAAMATRNFILMTENATIVKLAARNIQSQTLALEMFDYDNEDYLNTLHEELEVFRLLFVKWVRCFPKDEPVYPDGWGLYYTNEEVDRWNKLNPDEPVTE